MEVKNDMSKRLQRYAKLEEALNDDSIIEDIDEIAESIMKDKENKENNEKLKDEIGEKEEEIER